MCRHNSPQQLRFQPDYLRVTTDVIHKTGECYIGFSTNKPHARQSVGEVNGGQPGAIAEEVAPHPTQPGGQAYGGQPGAIAEEGTPHARHPVGEVEGGEPLASEQDGIPHARQPAGQVY